MAILPACPGLTVEILVNGVPLQEYDDEDGEMEPPNTITKYVEAQSGTHFSIRYKSTQILPEQALTVRVYLDGTEVAGSVYNTGKFKLNKPYTQEGRISLRGSQTVLQAFQFREMVIDKYLLDKLTSSGTVKVALQGSMNVTDGAGVSPMELAGIEEAPKRLSKDKQRHTQPPEPRQTTTTTWSRSDDIGSGPFAAFLFNYRSLDALQSLGIVPRETSPVPLEDRPEAELSAEELRQLVKRLREKDASAVKIKREKTEKRKRGIATNDDNDATDDFEVTEERNKKHRTYDPQDVIVIDWRRPIARSDIVKTERFHKENVHIAFAKSTSD